MAVSGRLSSLAVSLGCGPSSAQVILLLAGGDKSTQDADIRQAHPIAADWRRCRP